MSNPIVITRDTVSRPWAELDPKIAIALITGFLALIAVIIARSLGIKLPIEVYEVIPLAFALICGYFTKGTGTTITQFDSNGSKLSEETHHGPTVTTVSTPIQKPAVEPYVPATRSSFTDVITPTPDPAPVDQATEVLPPSSAFATARGYAPPTATDSEDTH